MPIVNRFAELQDEIAGWRRDIHAHPELGFDVQLTGQLSRADQSLLDDSGGQQRLIATAVGEQGDQHLAQPGVRHVVAERAAIEPAGIEVGGARLAPRVPPS